MPKSLIKARKMLLGVQNPYKSSISDGEKFVCLISLENATIPPYIRVDK